MIVKTKSYKVGDVKKLTDKLLFDEGISNFRYLRKAKSLIRSMKLIQFTQVIDLEKPLLYISPMPAHDAPFVLQSDRIIVEAEDEEIANDLIEAFISKHNL